MQVLCSCYVCYWRRHPSKQHVTDGGCNQELLQGPCNQAPIFNPEPTHNVFVRKSGPVKLRGKAAEIKCLGEPLLAYWSTCCDETNEQHQQILYLLQMSCKCEEISSRTRVPWPSATWTFKVGKVSMCHVLCQPCFASFWSRRWRCSSLPRSCLCLWALGSLTLVPFPRD